MNRYHAIEACIPAGTRLPDQLKPLCDYLDRTGYPLSGHMKLRPDDFGGLLAWFDGDAAMACRFAYFGAGPDGSILALWLLHGADASDAPVVHLGSEGVDNQVLAANFREFLTLLGIGYSELGFDDLAQPPEDPASAANFRAWLLAQYGIVCPLTGMPVVESAQARCPDLQAAIDAWLAQRHGASQR